MLGFILEFCLGKVLRRRMWENNFFYGFDGYE